MGKSLYYLGIAVWIGGVFLMIGNLTSIFPTVPFAGYTTTAIGSMIQWAGTRFLNHDSPIYRVTCCHCGGLLDAKKEFAGLQTTCGICKEAIVLPHLTQ